MNTAAHSAQSTTPTPTRVNGLPIDIVAILAALQDQIDELTAHVADQESALSRLTARTARCDAHEGALHRGSADGAGDGGGGGGGDASGPRTSRA